MMRVLTSGYCASWAAATMPAGPAADDEYVDDVGQGLRSIDAVARRVLDPWVRGHVPVLVEVHFSLRFLTRLCAPW